MGFHIEGVMVLIESLEIKILFFLYNIKEHHTQLFIKRAIC